MVDNFEQAAPDWRRRAAEVRERVDHSPGGKIKRLLERIARDYDMLAEIAQERRPCQRG
jgi:hypothetical protein